MMADDSAAAHDEVVTVTIPLGRILVVALAYIVIGLGTARLSAIAVTPAERIGWRRAAWLLSLAVFIAQITYARIRRGEQLRVSAVGAALAVGVATFVLAALGPVRAHGTAAALTLIIWPVATVIPAFLAALAVGSILRPR